MTLEEERAHEAEIVGVSRKTLLILLHAFEFEFKFRKHSWQKKPGNPHEQRTYEAAMREVLTVAVGWDAEAIDAAMEHL